jgi:glycosyltransferase involved in cell wall biosynthesis
MLSRTPRSNVGLVLKRNIIKNLGHTINQYQHESIVMAKKKKVLFIHHGSLEGGAPLSLLYTALGVAKNGYIPEVALLHPSEKLHAFYNQQGITTYEVPYIPFFIVWTGHDPNTFSLRTIKDLIKTTWKWKRSQKNIFQFITAHHYDLVHLNSAALSNVAQVLIQKKLPFVWHIREQGPTHKGLRFKFIHNLIAKSLNVIFLSEAERKSWGFDTHGVVINNFIDFKLFDFNENNKQLLYRENLGIGPTDFVILFLGGMHLFKGVDLLIKAVGSLINRYDNIKILMPGSTNYSSVYLDTLILELKVKDTLIRLPFDPNSIPFFSASDIVVFPASNPHFSRPIIEAGAMKKAVIASDFPVMRELVVNKKTGFLINPTSFTEFAQCIEKLILSPQLKQDMGEKGYIKAKKSFDASIQITKVLDIYKTALFK